jgi:hypothetical protein
MKGKLDLFDDIRSERREVDTRVLEQTVAQQAPPLDTILQGTRHAIIVGRTPSAP